MDSPLKTGGVAASLLVVGLALGVAISPDAPDQRETLEKASADLAVQDDFSPSAYSAAVTPALEADPLLVDFLSPVVEPGKDVTTGANFPRGARIEAVELTGDASGNFSVPNVGTCADSPSKTWCELTATNTSSTPLRLTAFVKYRVD